MDGRPTWRFSGVHFHSNFNFSFLPRYLYDTPIWLAPECDGVRVFSNDRCEFVQKVPEVLVQIFQIGSTSPGAMLYDAMEHHQVFLAIRGYIMSNRKRVQKLMKIFGALEMISLPL